MQYPLRCFVSASLSGHSRPSDEDREWFPDIAGSGDVMAMLRNVWANYRDESFVNQFLSPRLMRPMRLFHMLDDPAEIGGIKVNAIHNERGYRRVRSELARQYDVGFVEPPSLDMLVFQRGGTAPNVQALH
jgi:stage V sporulation protein R